MCGAMPIPAALIPGIDGILPIELNLAIVPK